MGRFTTLIGSLALVVAACGEAASPAATPAPATPAPATAKPVAATPAPTGPAPTATAELIAVKVSFDGKTCTYAGPSTVPTGSTLEWTFANTPLPVAAYVSVLVVAPVVDGTTWEQILAYLADEPRASVVPPWLKLPGVAAGGQAEIAGLLDDSAASGRTLKTTLARDAYYIGCNTSPEGGDKAFPAILLKTMKG